jgi:hypothetical protein
VRRKSLKVFAGVLMLGLLLGASSTAYADAFSLTSFSFSNLQFTASAGTAQFTVTGVTARADAGFNGGTQISNTSNSFPIAQANAAVNGITAAATANAATRSVSADTTASLTDCNCSAGSFGQGTLSGTLVLSGADGPVDVNISALQTLLWQVQTDAFGQYAESGLFFDLFVNDAPVFSFQVEALHPLTGPNMGPSSVQGSGQISRSITLQGGTTNTIFLRLSATSLVINSEVPEPATIVMLVSGVGVMTGVLKKRRRRPVSK